MALVLVEVATELYDCLQQKNQMAKNKIQNLSDDVQQANSRLDEWDSETEKSLSKLQSTRDEQVIKCEPLYWRCTLEEGSISGRKF